MTRLLPALLLAFFAFSSSAWAQTLGAVLTGAQEAPGPGDEDGFGHASVSFNEARDQVTITASVSGIGTPTAAHIHEGAAGVPGSVVIGFAGGSTQLVNGAAVSVAVDPALASAILANPSGYYVNVHTAAFPAGAVRGQLSAGAPVRLAGSMSGSREAPGPGDDDGRGAFLVTLDDTRTRLSFDVLVENIGTDYSGAHIHAGAAGVPGNVVVGLMSSSVPFVDGRLRGTVTIAPELGADLVANPGNYYVNVHTTQFPGGAVRGQLAPADAVVLPVVGHVAGAGGELFVTDVRIFNSSFDGAETALLEYFPSGAAHESAAISRLVPIAPRATVVFDDIAAGGLLGLESGIGSVRITSSCGLVASSRIFDDRRDDGGGTIGQYFPGLSGSAALRRGVLPHLASTTAASDRGAFRSNLGFFNPNSSPVTVQLVLLDEDGTLVAQRTITLEGQMHRQLGLTGSGQWFDLGSAEHPDLTLTFSASAPLFAYASVLDNVTSDPVAIIAAEDSGEPVQ